MKYYLSVIIPAFNEETNFRRGVLNQVYDYLSKQPYPYQVIIVDDGSHDQTRTLINQFIERKPAWQLIANPHYGKAHTVATGILSAQGQFSLFTDFDQATPIKEVEKLLPFVQKEYHLAIGSREIRGAKREAEPWYRHLMGKIFNLFVKLITIKGIQDTQCGFKLFRSPVAKDIFRRLIVYQNRQETHAFTGAFDVELLYLAKKRGYRIKEVPVIWHHIHSDRVNPWRDSIKMFTDLIKIRTADWLGKYD